MVYYAHATDPVTFGTFFVLYYVIIPAVLLTWFWKYYVYIKKRQYKLKQLGVLILLAFILTSFSGFKVLEQYLYLYSPVEKMTCYSSSCVLSSPLVTEYGFVREDFEEFGVPSLGFMRIYRIYDTELSASLLTPKKLNYVVIARPLLFLPVTELHVYEVSENKRLVTKDKFYLVWPKSPGKFLTEKFDAKFSVMILEGGY
ncbi:MULTISPECIES: hypothetical protein [Thermococcus]|uniref:Uncharacterized protein n=2 Tax=Thermococcus sibiricus TaxID=172049 RepID=C6A545_THESM|nr:MULTISPECIES: hypothetical protein [Thermococcus]ACS90740.1 hypothetical protein TSIB_1689 [Thermococcus sibiricus MM 739]KUK17501.1 MAG: Uncharacterized protein XD54_1182 [Thermococcus sibiricus]MBC7094236.1 hypothetical protein [Thermococcus sp.]